MNTVIFLTTGENDKKKHRKNRPTGTSDAVKMVCMIKLQNELIRSDQCISVINRGQRLDI